MMFPVNSADERTIRKHRKINAGIILGPAAFTATPAYRLKVGVLFAQIFLITGFVRHGVTGWVYD